MNALQKARDSFRSSENDPTHSGRPGRGSSGLGRKPSRRVRAAVLAPIAVCVLLASQSTCHAQISGNVGFGQGGDARGRSRRNTTSGSSRNRNCPHRERACSWKPTCS